MNSFGFRSDCRSATRFVAAVCSGRAARAAQRRHEANERCAKALTPSEQFALAMRATIDCWEDGEVVAGEKAAAALVALFRARRPLVDCREKAQKAQNRR